MDAFPNPRKTTAFRDLGPVDVRDLRAAVGEIPEAVWARENAAKPNKFGALDLTRHIVFRFVSRWDDWRASSDSPLWPEWRALLEPVLTQATAAYGYTHAGFPRIMLARMPAGGKIAPHRDENPAARWPHKIHVPLFTDEKVTFFVDGVGRHLPVGEAVEVNNMGVHAVANDSAHDRTHLIFEYYDLDQPAPPWARPL